MQEAPQMPIRSETEFILRWLEGHPLPQCCCDSLSKADESQSLGSIQSGHLCATMPWGLGQSYPANTGSAPGSCQSCLSYTKEVVSMQPSRDLEVIPAPAALVGAL